MTEASYQQNRRSGAIGRSTAMCYPASFDRISKKGAISAATYQEYDRARIRYTELAEALVNKADEKSARIALIRRVWQELLVQTPKNVVEQRVTDEAALARSLTKLLNGGFRPALYLNNDGSLHMVGVLKSAHGVYVVRSNWTPFDDEDQVSAEELFEYLDRTRSRPNVLALPPERR